MKNQPYRKTICARKGCDKEASLFPVLDLYATKLIVVNVPSEPIQVEFRELPTCLECSGGVKEDDILNDAGWQKISDAIERSGRAKPNRDLTELKWKTLSTGEIYDSGKMQ